MCDLHLMYITHAERGTTETEAILRVLHLTFTFECIAALPEVPCHVHLQSPGYGIAVVWFSAPLKLDTCLACLCEQSKLEHCNNYTICYHRRRCSLKVAS